MPTFGKFETVRELSSFHGADVYVARQAGEKPPRDYVVKVFSLNRSFGDDEQTKTDLQPLVQDLNRTFAQRIELQKKAAEQSPHVAPIIDSGADRHGPWYATRFYPRTLQKMILGKVNLSPECILHIIRGVTNGALALRAAGARSHGNLKPANVLLSGAAKITNTEVAVTDPMPGEISAANDFELADLQAIGRLLYQLVRRRELADAEQWMTLPIQMSKEWTDTFGKDAQAWLDICNRLLECRSLEFYKLDRLASDLKALKPKAALSPAVIIGAVILVVALGGVALVIHARKTAPGVAVSQQNNTPPKTSLPPPKAQTGTVIIRSDPPGAHVIVDYEEKGITPFTNTQAVGDDFHYELNMKYRNYLQESTNVTIHSNGEMVNIFIQMTNIVTHEGQGTVIFECTPFIRGVVNEVWRVNGKGKTIYWPSKNSPMPEMGMETEMPPGDYIFTSKYQAGVVHWREENTPFTVIADQPKGMTNNFLHGTVKIASDPAGASVFLGQRKLGETPLQPILRFWPPGPLTLRFEMDQYESTDVTVSVQLDMTNYMTARLNRSSGFVILTTDPPGAEILDANEQSRGRTGADGAPVILALTSGLNQVAARYPGLDEFTTNVLVRKDQTNSYRLPLNYVKAILEVDPPTAIVSSGTSTFPVRSNYVFYQKPGAEVPYTVTAPEYVATNFMATVTSGSQTYSIQLDPKDGTHKKLFGINLVQLKPDFWVGQYDVTQWQYLQTMGNNPSTFHSSTNLPVDSVSWNDAQAFCQQLTKNNRQTAQFHTNLVFRLPTYAEWNNDIAGDAAAHPIQDTNLYVFKATEPAPVNSRKPNARGLYDVRGNMWQWLQDSPDPTRAQQAGSAYDSLVLGRVPQSGGAPGVGTTNSSFRVVLAPPL